MARVRKGQLLDTARRVLGDPTLVAVGALTRADVPSMTRARSEFRKQDIALKKLPNRLCDLAVADTDREFLAGLFSGDTCVMYPLSNSSDAPALARRVLAGAKGAKNVLLVGGALDAVPLTAAELVLLADSKPKAEILADVGRALRAPLVNVGRALKAPAARTGRALKAPPARVGRAAAALRAKRDASDPEVA